MAKLTVEALIASDIERVWSCRTQPEHIVHRNFASDERHCPSAINDLREGGTFSYTMAAKDASMSFAYAGVYTHIVPHQSIVCVLGEFPDHGVPEGRVVQVTFETTEGGVRIAETFDAEEVHSLELQKQGWQAILNNFTGYVEAFSL